MKTVFVGLSGGVDSSVGAWLLKEQGYQVVGVYMKNWTKAVAGVDCPWREDYQAAKALASYLDIDFRVFDFQKDYRRLVVETMLADLQLGKTPNPDITCNQEIKFKLFFEAALAAGADLIATGHYARRQATKLLRAKDDFKDQTYFLYRISPRALKQTLFPVGGYLKSQVRQLAQQAKLPTADRAESMGICFVGKVGWRQFLSQYVDPQPGAIIDDTGQEVGCHQGAIFYTIGQRQGLGLGGGLPYYVTGKDMAKNEVWVSRNLNNPKLWAKQLKLTSLHWLTDRPRAGQQYQLRVRHQAPLVSAQLELTKTQAEVRLATAIRAATAGQSAVIYDQQQVVGGGIIS